MRVIPAVAQRRYMELAESALSELDFREREEELFSPAAVPRRDDLLVRVMKWGERNKANGMDVNR